jgi:hypothetical protein
MGWDAKFNETLDIKEDANRISAFGTKSAEQTSIATAVKKTPEKTKSMFSLGGLLGSSGSGNNKSTYTSGRTDGDNADEEEDDDEDGTRENEDSEEDDDEDDEELEEEEEEEEEEDNEEEPSQKKLKKQKSSFGDKIGKMMSKAASKIRGMNNSSSSKKSIDENGDGRRQKKHRRSKERKNQNNDEDQHSLHREPTAEEIANFEAEINKERIFIQTLQTKGFHIIEIEGDGNCLFRAISHQLYLNEEYHEQLRHLCCEHLKKHQNRFEKFIVDIKFSEYIMEMSKHGTWADDIEIRAMEELLDRNIHIYSSNSTNPKDYLVPVNENPDEEKLMFGVPPLNLSYHGQSHYNSIYYDRTPLPFPARSTKVLLNARMALSEGKSVPLPGPTIPVPSGILRNANGSYQGTANGLPPNARLASPPGLNTSSHSIPTSSSSVLPQTNKNVPPSSSANSSSNPHLQSGAYGLTVTPVNGVGNNGVPPGILRHNNSSNSPLRPPATTAAVEFSSNYDHPHQHSQQPQQKPQQQQQQQHQPQNQQYRTQQNPHSHQPQPYLKKEMMIGDEPRPVAQQQQSSQLQQSSTQQNKKIDINQIKKNYEMEFRRPSVENGSPQIKNSPNRLPPINDRNKAFNMGSNMPNANPSAAHQNSPSRVDPALVNAMKANNSNAVSTVEQHTIGTAYPHRPVYDDLSSHSPNVTVNYSAVYSDGSSPSRQPAYLPKQQASSNQPANNKAVSEMNYLRQKERENGRDKGAAVDMKPKMTPGQLDRMLRP